MTTVWENVGTRREDWGVSDVERLNERLAAILAANPKIREAASKPIDWDAIDRKAQDEWKARRSKALGTRLPERYREAVPRHAATRAWIERYDNGDGPNMAIVGDAGTGKTWEATAIARLLLERLTPALFVEVPEMVARLRPDSDGMSDIGQFQAAPVLILDDLGAEKTTEWVVEQLYLLTNFRHNRCLPTVFTTNLTTDQIETRYGARIARRLLQGAVQLHIPKLKTS